MTTRREQLVEVLRSIGTEKANQIADAAVSFRNSGGSGAGNFLDTIQVTVPQSAVNKQALKDALHYVQKAEDVLNAAI